MITRLILNPFTGVLWLCRTYRHLNWEFGGDVIWTDPFPYPRRFPPTDVLDKEMN